VRLLLLGAHLLQQTYAILHGQTEVPWLFGVSSCYPEPMMHRLESRHGCGCWRTTGAGPSLPRCASCLIVNSNVSLRILTEVFLIFDNFFSCQFLKAAEFEIFVL
jgi:hypothetical protein